MKKFVALFVLAMLAAAPALAMKVYVDYDRDAELGQYKTFQYMENKDSGVSDPLADKRIVEGLENMLTQIGLTKVDSNADLFATYTVTTKEQESYNTTVTGFGYGYGPGWGRYGYGGYGYGGASMASAQTTVTTWVAGTLLVDVWDAKTQKLVWRGSANDYLKQKPEKRAKQLEKAYSLMMKRWNDIKSGKKK